jgi:class 3 adenylate cyclase
VIRTNPRACGTRRIPYERPEPATNTPAVTLLFTDIEGSTRLVRRLGQGYAAVLVEHRHLLRRSVEGHGGRVVDSHGDGFFAAFREPSAAVSAIASAQRALASHSWPQGARIAVRAGVHTGEPVAVGDAYVGLDVHRVARICAAAHGGQVLLSQDTAERLRDQMPPGIKLRHLGQHTLRDLPRPEHLVQLSVPGLPTEFPPLRTESPVLAPERSILVLAEADEAAVSLVEVAEPLSRSRVPHELIVTRLIETRAGRQPQGAADSLGRATSELHDLRATLGKRGVAARVAAFTSAEIGKDAVRLAEEQGVDLLLLERSPRQLGRIALDSELVAILDGALCDVAVYVRRNGNRTGVGDCVLVPFGGDEHDWAALELGAWLASASDTRLRLLGVARDPEAKRRDASRLLASAALAVQQLVGVETEPTLLSPRVGALLEASAEGALLVTGFPSDWRNRGLGTVRSELANAAGLPTLFVRRGVRPGALAPVSSHTRFTWSRLDSVSDTSSRQAVIRPDL